MMSLLSSNFPKHHHPQLFCLRLKSCPNKRYGILLHSANEKKKKRWKKFRDKLEIHEKKNLRITTWMLIRFSLCLCYCFSRYHLTTKSFEMIPIIVTSSDAVVVAVDDNDDNWWLLQQLYSRQQKKKIKIKIVKSNHVLWFFVTESV